MKIEDIYPPGYLEQVYLSKMCIHCSSSCSRCTNLYVERLYLKNKDGNVPTAIYKCQNYMKS